MINYAAFNQAKPVDERTPFVGEGEHILAVVKYEEFKSVKHGQSLGATFMVVQSTKHAPGTIVFQGWYPARAPSYVGDTGEVDRAADFIKHLLDVKLDQSGTKMLELVQNAASQPARGILVKAKGVEKPAKPKRDGTMGKAFTQMTWEHIPGQTGETIATYRAQIDAALAAALKPAAPPPVAPVAPVAFAPAVTGIGTSPTPVGSTVPLLAQLGLIK